MMRVEVPVQINGKTKVIISIPVDISKEDAIAKGKEALGDQFKRNRCKRDLCSQEDCEHCCKTVIKKNLGNRS